MTNSMQIIFYGAGKFAADNVEHLIQEGLVPVCFTDADTSKHYTEFPTSVGAREILPLEEAIKRYENYVIYLTVSDKFVKEIAEYMIKCGVPESCIKYGEIRLRRGCCYLGSFINFTSSSVTACCYPDNPIHVARSKSLYKDSLEYFAKNLFLTCDIMGGRAIRCENCTKYQLGLYPKTIGRISHISFGTSPYKDVFCNSRCIYCSFEHDSDKSLLDDLRTILYEYTNFLLDDNLTISFASGELTALKNSKEIFSICKENAIKINLLTNAIRFSKELADYGNIGYLQCSLDSGTRETFEKIKRVDAFGRVTQNIKRYRDCGIKFNLKYILLEGINDNKTEIDAFLEFAGEINAANVILSKNWLSKESKAHYPELFWYFLQRAKDLGFSMNQIVCDLPAFNQQEKNMLINEMKLRDKDFI